MVIILIDELIKYQALDLNKLILRIYAKLDLLPDEAVMLLHLLSFYQQNREKTFPLSYNALRNKTGMDKKENGLLIQSLMDKRFIDLKLEKIKEKEQECVDVTNALNRIEEFLNNEKEEENNRLLKQSNSEVNELFEINLGRTLSPFELDLLQQNSKFYKKCDYERAIFEISKDKDVTIKECIEYLKREKMKEKGVDKENGKAILDFFESINKKS